MAVLVRRARCFIAILLLAPVGFVFTAPRAGAGPVAGYSGRIAFTRYAGPDQEANGTYTVNRDGSGEVQLTHNGGPFGAYSADGSQLAYLDEGGISVMDADGTDKHVLVP